MLSIVNVVDRQVVMSVPLIRGERMIGERNIVLLVSNGGTCVWLCVVIVVR